MSYPNTIVIVQNVTKTYSNNGNSHLTVLNNVSFTIERGKITALLGPNGAGKSTLIELMCGITTPSKGHIVITNYDIVKNDEKALQSVGILFEGNRNFNWRLTAKENLEYYGRLRGLKGQKLKERVEYLLCYSDLYEKRYVFSGNLSRGMQQNLSIMISIIADPPLLILDEPFNGLDIFSVNQLKEMITDLAENKNKAVIIATHDIDLIDDIAHNLIIMKGGEIVFSGYIEKDSFNLKNEYLKMIR